MPGGRIYSKHKAQSMTSIEHFNRVPQHVAEKAHAADLHDFISELAKPMAKWVSEKGAKLAQGKKKK